METRQLSVIRKAEALKGSVLASTELPSIKGEGGDVSYTCGGCRAVLIEAVDAGQIARLVLRCPACGAYNKTLD